MSDEKQVGGSHYISLKIPPWDVMQAWFPESFPDYLLMNALKYIARNKCDKREDIQKAMHYLEKWLELTSSPFESSQTSADHLSQEGP
jgi:hypothetical protein